MLLYSRQEASSDPSEQSASPSQMAARAIHSPLAQVASEKPQAVGGRVVGTRPAKSHYSIRGWRLATDFPHLHCHNPKTGLLHCSVLEYRSEVTNS